MFVWKRERERDMFARTYVVHMVLDYFERIGREEEKESEGYDRFVYRPIDTYVTLLLSISCENKNLLFRFADTRYRSH